MHPLASIIERFPSGARLNARFSYITNQESLHQLCDQIEKDKLVAFDTEFVAEDSYRPELCLVQVAVQDGIHVIDPYSIDNLDPFWNLLTSPETNVVVHAGREETLFCYRATQRLIPNLFDIQLAAAFLGHEYPASYANLVHRYTGINLDKEETRSDWRKRPLSNQQLQYAAQDVKDLLRLHRSMEKELAKLDRVHWVQEETTRWQEDLGQYESNENWYRISGIQALSGNSLSIVRALWMWREQRAKERDLPARKVLRDDLLIELARRGNGDERRMASLRGMEHRHVKQLIPELAKVIEEAMDHPVPSWPRKMRYGKGQPPAMLTQFLSAALAYICRTKRISPAVVATADDLRDFVKFRLDGSDPEIPPPSLVTGWRAEIIGRELDDLLGGRLAMVLDNPDSDMPIRFHRI
jgi:ribonuclease D